MCCKDGSLVQCDSCPRSFHRRCYDKDIAKYGDFICGQCDSEIPDSVIAIDASYTDISKDCEAFKRGLREYYKENRIMFMKKSKLYSSSYASRNASSNIHNRIQLLKDQGGYCAGLLMANGVYRTCNNKATECDHIIELRHGGIDSIEYLQMLCCGCHRDKTRKNKDSNGTM